MLFNQNIYAGFFARAAAFILDGIIVAIFVALVLYTTTYVLAEMGLDPSLSTFASGIISFIAIIYYYVVLPITKIQGTIGKHLFAICITDKDGRQITFLRSLLRFIAYYACSIPLIIGLLVFGGDMPMLLATITGFVLSPLSFFGSLTFALLYMTFATLFIPFSFLMVGLTKQKTGLHDTIANTRVCYKYNL